jgi:hypothetical protein
MNEYFIKYSLWIDLQPHPRQAFLTGNTGLEAWVEFREKEKREYGSDLTLESIARL